MLGVLTEPFPEPSSSIGHRGDPLEPLHESECVPVPVALREAPAYLPARPGVFHREARMIVRVLRVRASVEGGATRGPSRARVAFHELPEIHSCHEISERLGCARARVDSGYAHVQLCRSLIG